MRFLFSSLNYQPCSWTCPLHVLPSPFGYPQCPRKLKAVLGTHPSGTCTGVRLGDPVPCRGSGCRAEGGAPSSIWTDWNKTQPTLTLAIFSRHPPGAAFLLEAFSEPHVAAFPSYSSYLVCNSIPEVSVACWYLSPEG